MKSILKRLMAFMLFMGSFSLVSCYAAPWVFETPEEHGLITAELQTASDNVESIGGRQGFVVVKDGVIVFEEYYADDENQKNTAYSGTKTFSAVVFGIAQDMGYLDIDDTVASWTTPPSGMMAGATIRNVLTHTAQSSSPEDLSFSYTNDMLDKNRALSKALKTATGMQTDDFIQTYLTGPLGLENYSWSGDWFGNVDLAGNLKASCRDIARMGVLLLNGGSFHGTQIVSSSYVTEMIQPVFPEANTAYGLLIWLNTPDSETRQWHRPTVSGTGKMLQNAPDNVYMATGFGGQLIIVIPDHDMVVTTMGFKLDFETLNTLQAVWNAIEPALPE